MNGYRGHWRFFKDYFLYEYKEREKKRIVSFVGYSVIKSVLKVDDSNKAFKAVEQLMGFEKYIKEKEPETYDSIINDLFGGKE